MNIKPSVSLLFALIAFILFLIATAEIAFGHSLTDPWLVPGGLAAFVLAFIFP